MNFLVANEVIENVIMMGGASNEKKLTPQIIQMTVKGKFYNIYANKDIILQVLMYKEKQNVVGQKAVW